MTFKHSAVITLRDWELCQLDPPCFDYEEPEAQGPTLLRAPPPATVLASPFAEFGQHDGGGSRSGDHRPSISASPSGHVRFTSYHMTLPRSHGLEATPGIGDEGDSPLAPILRTPRRRETIDSHTTPSLLGDSTSISSGPSDTGSASAARQMSIDIPKSTKRLTIGKTAFAPTQFTTRTATSSSVTAPMTLKTTSAPSRTSDNSSSEQKPSQTSGGGAGSGKAKHSDKSMKERKIDGPRRSK